MGAVMDTNSHFSMCECSSDTTRLRRGHEEKNRERVSCHLRRGLGGGGFFVDHNISQEFFFHNAIDPRTRKITGFQHFPKHHPSPCRSDKSALRVCLRATRCDPCATRGPPPPFGAFRILYTLSPPNDDGIYFCNLNDLAAEKSPNALASFMLCCPRSAFRCHGKPWKVPK